MMTYNGFVGFVEKSLHDEINAIAFLGYSKLTAMSMLPLNSLLYPHRVTDRREYIYEKKIVIRSFIFAVFVRSS